MEVIVGCPQESFTLNRLGQRKTATDRRTTEHTYSYDVLGRMTADAVTVLGGADGAVRRLEVLYDEGLRPFAFTSYDAASAGNIVNQVARYFNGLGQQYVEYQAHSGAVDGNSPYVAYTYSEMASGANHSRLTNITYPTTSRVLNYVYSSGLDDTLSRLSSMTVGSTTLESYTYLGLATTVKRAHPEPSLDLTYFTSGSTSSDSQDQYTGLDRFGRIREQRWVQGGSTDTDKFKYGYDRNGNRLYRDNLLKDNRGELYHTNGAANGYDGLNQLTDFRRGVLSDADSDGEMDTVTTATRDQVWALDAQGNWSTLTTGGSGQTRTHNQQNQILTLTGVSPNPTFDATGNMTRDDGNRTFTYDAWNRLVSGSWTGGSVTFAFDALGRRIKETTGGVTRDLYYSAGWQVLEERISGKGNPIFYTWSPVYVDALVARDQGSERLYVQQDANFNVTALVSRTGTVLERYVYDPYGQPTALDPSTWAARTSIGYSWAYLHQGGRYFRFDVNGVNGMYHFRNREFSPTLGRWMQVDPAGFKAGDTNLYRDVLNNPVRWLDPLGLSAAGQVGLYAAQSPAHYWTMMEALYGAAVLSYGAGAAWYITERLPYFSIGTGGAVIAGGGAVVVAGGAATGVSLGIAGGIEILAGVGAIAYSVYQGACLLWAYHDFVSEVGLGVLQFNTIGNTYHDKWLHCFVSCLIARRCGYWTAASVGLTYEVAQAWFGKMGYDTAFDVKDMAANAAGLLCAAVKPCGPVGKDCASCCSNKFSRFWD